MLAEAKKEEAAAKELEAAAREKIKAATRWLKHLAEEKERKAKEAKAAKFVAPEHVLAADRPSAVSVTAAEETTTADTNV